LRRATHRLVSGAGNSAPDLVGTVVLPRFERRSVTGDVPLELRIGGVQPIPVCLKSPKSTPRRLLWMMPAGGADRAEEERNTAIPPRPRPLVSPARAAKPALARDGSAWWNPCRINAVDCRVHG
jgi:hypothetical protein